MISHEKQNSLKNYTLIHQFLYPVSTIISEIFLNKIIFYRGNILNEYFYAM